METRLMLTEEYRRMKRAHLLSCWLKDQLLETFPTREQIHMAIASFEAYGPEAIAGMLKEAYFETRQEIKLQEAKEFFAKMREREDFRIFDVCFIKKQDGTIRNMEARLMPKTKEMQNDLLVVWDVEKQGIRTINLSLLISFKVENVFYVVLENKNLVEGGAK